MIGVLQTGTVLHIQNKHVTRESRFVMKTLRSVTGKRLGDDPRAWIRWFVANRRSKRTH
ncbi:MAG: hypothetical protein V3T86_18120 [Planctomycetota bacterium]